MFNKENRKKWVRNNRSRINKSQHKHWIKKKFGITPEIYEEMLNGQDRRCAICGSYTGDKLNRKLAVDHNHETEKIRGLLCVKCNMGIGYLRDSAVLLENALSYLKKYKN